MHKVYTIIGLYDDTGQVFAHATPGRDAHDAMRNTAAKFDGSLQIIGAIEGNHKLVAACEDGGKAAYAVDLAPAEPLRRQRAVVAAKVQP